MKSIIFIIPYFGHFNNYFEIWLNSCAHNPTIDWLIFTDCKDEHNYPENVKVVYTTFADIRSRFQSFYDFPISLEKPYKLCDFRPAYGEVFYDYIKDYDFWGYCDIDLVWGDMRKFLTEEILGQYDKIGNHGHCCILRNTDELRKLYRYESDTRITYNEAFSSSLSFLFDEDYLAFGGFCKELGIASYDNITFFDIDFAHDDYRVPPYEKNIFAVYAHNIFEYDNGKLLLWSVIAGGNTVSKKDIFYVHFQKRKMKVNTDSFNHYLIYKDTFSSVIPVDVEVVKKIRSKNEEEKFVLLNFMAKNKSRNIQE